MIKLSKAGKMPCRSWSLQALDTCPASKNKDGSLVDACKGCYATTGNYRFPNVKAPREHNKEDWKRKEWVSEMVCELDNDRYFRWFDSGDMYDLRLAKKIYQVMALTPHCNHWIPTRMHKFAKFAGILERMESLPNVVVRKSSDSINGEVINGVHSSTIIRSNDPVLVRGADKNAKVVVCEAYERDGKCGDCRACWNKDVNVIAYVAHGKNMQKLIKIHEVV